MMGNSITGRSDHRESRESLAYLSAPAEGGSGQIKSICHPEKVCLPGAHVPTRETSRILFGSKGGNDLLSLLVKLG